MAIKLVQEETLLHQEAFEFYYSLGKNRNITKVAQKFGVNRKKHYKSFAIGSK